MLLLVARGCDVSYNVLCFLGGVFFLQGFAFFVDGFFCNNLFLFDKDFF